VIWRPPRLIRILNPNRDRFLLRVSDQHRLLGDRDEQALAA
jgi:hypothetical protein